MGAVSVSTTLITGDLVKSYRYLQEEERHLYGHDYYAGHFGVCDLDNNLKTYDKYKKTNEKKGWEILENYTEHRKSRVQYVDLGPMHWEATTIKKERTDNKVVTTKRKKYVVTGLYEEYAEFDTKKQAEDYAVQMKLDEPGRSLKVVAEYLNGEQVVLTRLKEEVKKYKTKPKLKDVPNRKVQAIHKYLLFGLARC